MKHVIVAATLLLALALSACGGGSQPSGTSGTAEPGSSSQAASSPTPAPAGAQQVTLSDFKITPASVTVSGGAVTLLVKSAGPTPHNLFIADASGKVVARSRDLNAGQSDTLHATLAPGMYMMYCDIPGHKSLGMQAMLMVNP